jgi:hypothetical protein
MQAKQIKTATIVLIAVSMLNTPLLLLPAFHYHTLSKSTPFSREGTLAGDATGLHTFKGTPFSRELL